MTRFDHLYGNCLNFFENNPNMDKQEFLFLARQSIDFNITEPILIHPMKVEIIKLQQENDMLRNNIKSISKLL